MFYYIHVHNSGAEGVYTIVEQKKCPSLHNHCAQDVVQVVHEGCTTCSSLCIWYAQVGHQLVHNSAFLGSVQACTGSVGRLVQYLLSCVNKGVSNLCTAVHFAVLLLWI